MLLRCIEFELRGTKLVLVQNVLDRFEIVVAHIRQFAAIVVQLFGNRLGHQVGLAASVKFPVEASGRADGHF